MAHMFESYSMSKESKDCASSSFLNLFVAQRHQLGLLMFYHIHSFIQAISIAPLQVHNYSETLLDTVSEFHAEASQATASEGLAQGPYVAERESNARHFGIKATNLLMSHSAHT